MKRLMFVALGLLASTPAYAQHITKAAVDRILAPVEAISDSSTARVPAGLPLSAGLFAGKPWWAVLQMCSEHRSGAGRPPSAPAPVLDATAERNRVFFMRQAGAQFAKESSLPTADDGLLPVSGWGSDLGASMNAAAANGSWSSSEFEDACRILGAQAARGI